ncbi:MAG: hypothetical protein Ta2A_10000 [Treponemataceae bacterium]|nr:MAG: hypothetical protein Ta2A_10000 [Treponemataceae bacterium]
MHLHNYEVFDKSFFNQQPRRKQRGMLFLPRNCTQVRIPFFRPNGRGMHPFGTNKKYFIEKDAKIKLFFIAVVALAFFSCASIVPDETVYPKSPIPKDIIGICHAGTPGSEQENVLLDELGITWVRNDFRWNDIERSDGVWNFAGFDRIVEANNKRGRKMLGVLAFDTSWLHELYGGKTDAISAQELPRYLAYVEKVVTRYKGKVEAWEIWNEPNVSVRFWTGSAKDFYALSKAAAAKIRECDPNAKIVAGAFWRVPARFIENMFAYGAFADVDAISFHPYAVNPAAVAHQYDKFAALTKKMHFSGEIWVTEIGYPTGGMYPNRVSEKKLGSYIRDTFTALALRGARVIVWYHLKDNFTKDAIPKTFDSEKFFGLVYSDYEKKQGVIPFTDIL